MGEVVLEIETDDVLLTDKEQSVIDAFKKCFPERGLTKKAADYIMGYIISKADFSNTAPTSLSSLYRSVLVERINSVAEYFGEKPEEVIPDILLHPDVFFGLPPIFWYCGHNFMNG